MIRFYNDWPALLQPGRYHWVDFTVAHLSVEMDRRFGTLEVAASLLGFHVELSVTVSKGDAAFKADIDDVLAELESGALRISIPLAEYEALKNVTCNETIHVACQSGAVIREEGE